AALCHRRPAGLPAGAPLLLVPDSLEGLAALGRYARARSEATCLAVTGSVGKTSTKEMLRHVLAQQGPTFASAASHNNHWGVPLTLARLPLEARYAVFEIGMNHPGEIRPLTRMVQPLVALITTIAAAHVEYFPDGLAGIADAKAEIFEGLTPGGYAVINADAPMADRLIGRASALGARVVTFGRAEAATVRLLDLSLHATCSAVKVRLGRETLDYCLSLPGEHMAMNSLGVLAAVRAAGADPVRAATAMAGLKSLKGRGLRQRIDLDPGDQRRGAFDLIDDSYNANPTSMRAAFAVLAQSGPEPGGRRVAVLGDMLELGPDGAALHRALAEPLLAAGVDLLFCCGPQMHGLYDAIPAERRGHWAPDSQALAPVVAERLRSGDVVLVKGSLGSRMARVIERLSSGASPSAASA
ncbi:MAG TPA: UDP-N-acetylmuramoyl-tripeptide--D-alanyl-D-alanine ligase, partial [Kiloniellales bacterium]|nr:UDP-N-acetylmuramoyl-tripeptide--D-alanyl-D-alanine ligase [Kiloniellales bacterium]